MALNGSHSYGGGVVLPSGEWIAKHCEDVELTFSDMTNKSDIFKGTKKGTVFLTPYRIIFLSKCKDPMMSFQMPLTLIKGCSIEQPMFSANYIKGVIQAEPGGGWEGRASFKMVFSSGGAIEFGQLMFKYARDPPRQVPFQTFGYGFGYIAGGYVPGGYGPAPGPYVAGPYTHTQMNGYEPAPQPMGYAYGPPPGTYPPPGMIYMAPPPPYPGPSPPPGPSAPSASGAPGGNSAAPASSSAYYDPANPHNVYISKDQPPPYSPPEKKNN